MGRPRPLSARDTVLPWDGENLPRRAPWVVADVGQVGASVHHHQGGEAEVALLREHGYRSVFDQGQDPCCTGPALWPAGLSRRLSDDRRNRDHRPLPSTGPGPWPGWRPPAGASPAAARLLGRRFALPALVVTAWLLAGLPLLMLGRFTLPLMLAVSVPLAAVLLVVGLRSIPAGGLPPGRTPPPASRARLDRTARLDRRARPGGR